MGRAHLVLAIKEAVLSLSGLSNHTFVSVLAQALSLLSKRAEETHEDNLRILFLSRILGWF